MPAKTTAKPKATAADKKVAKPAKKTASKGDTLVCNVCGLSVVVEQIGDVAIRQERGLFCCDEPMKTKATRAAPTKKTAAAKK